LASRVARGAALVLGTGGGLLAVAGSLLGNAFSVNVAQAHFSKLGICFGLVGIVGAVAVLVKSRAAAWILLGGAVGIVFSYVGAAMVFDGYIESTSWSAAEAAMWTPIRRLEFGLRAALPSAASVAVAASLAFFVSRQVPSNRKRIQQT
jgi:hypothetical protein